MALKDILHTVYSTNIVCIYIIYNIHTHNIFVFTHNISKS